MPRVNHWPDKLALFVEEKRDQPFDWKTNNCAFFACDWLVIVFGIDPAKEYRELTPLQLARAIRKKPLDEIATEVCMSIGWYCVTPAYAQRGDIVEIITEGYPAMGVCIGERSVFAGRDGIFFQKTIECRRAWRVE